MPLENLIAKRQTCPIFLKYNAKSKRCPPHENDRFGRMEVNMSAKELGKIGFERCASIPASNDLSLSELVAFAVTATSIGRISFPYLCRRIRVASYPYY
jgi:hypothetical protein